MKVIFVRADGTQVRVTVDRDVLASAGILELGGRYFVFSHFVKGEDAAEYAEAFVVHVGPMP